MLRFLAVVFTVALAAGTARAQASDRLLQLECAVPDGSKCVVLIDLAAETAWFNWLASKEIKSGWQGPTWAMKHDDGGFSWYGFDPDPRTHWFYDRARGVLEVEYGKGGGCCASLAEIKSVSAHCTERWR